MTYPRLRPLLPAGPRSLASWVFFSLAAASGAFAADPCESNTDCPAGYQCEALERTPDCPPPPLDCQGDACVVECDEGVATGGVCVEIPDGCASDADCDEGYVCVASPVACAEPACPEGPEGDACRETSTSTCDDAQSGGFCVEDFRPATCDTDADCSEGDVCERFVYEECSGAVEPCAVDSSGNVQCDDPPMGPDEECRVVEEAYCIPRYAASCEADEDCGPGFTCEALETCACSGSSGTMEGGEGDEDSPEGTFEECVCEPSDERYCALQELPCTSTEECPAGLECVIGYGNTSSCSIDSEGNVECPDDQPELSLEGRCMPPDYALPGGPGGSVEPEVGTDTGATTSGGNQREEEPAVGSDTDADGDTGSDADTDSTPTSFSFGCTSAGTDPSLAGLALLAFGLLRRRRRS